MFIHTLLPEGCEKGMGRTVALTARCAPQGLNIMAKVLNFYHIGKVIPENAEYMGRAMPHVGLKQSKFANPFKLSKDEPRGATIERYRIWLWQQIRSGKITIQDLLDLDGKDLVCFCKQPNKEVACHCDVILSAIEWAKQRSKND